jgi:sortase A
MKLVVRQRPLKRLLHLTQRLLFACAGLMLAYTAFILIDNCIFEHRESRRLEGMLAPRARTAPPALAAGLIGRLEISRLGLSAIVMEGTDGKTLRRAAGHISGTSLPGQPGNVGIAGHRDTLFRPLRNIRRDDIIKLTTLRGDFIYRVVSTRVVSPSDVAVLDSGSNEILTLVTCYPFYFIGSAPDRFIVRAERVGRTS